MRLSVIVPLYNCAPVIERCLDSIEAFPGMEVVVVDDGSTDDGASVVQAYIESHPHVRLVRKKNGGVSSARNMGVEEAFGDYIAFVDADDYLALGGMEKVVGLAEENKADVLKYKIVSVQNDTQPGERVSVESISYDLIIGRGKALKGIEVSDFHVVDGIFRRTLLMDNNIRFHTDLYLREDDVFMAEVYVKAERVVATDLPLYRYVVCSTYSHTHDFHSDRTRKIVDSELLAVKYRLAAVAELDDPQVNALERLKAMKYAFSCSRNMQLAGYSYSEYRKTLEAFRSYGCYPLKYRWLKVRMKVTPRLLMKTFLCNHPCLAWKIYKK